MIIFRVVNILALIIFLWVGIFNAQVLAKTPRALVTVTGKSLSFSDTRSRLSQMLSRLGEPTWTRKELNRLTVSVHAYLKAFTGRQYSRTLETLQRGDRYRPMIRNKLKSANISLSFEALAMAESAFRFNAKSPAGARGLWQYMPASARHYGLHVSHKLDERMDPALSTDAAIKYLKFLNKKFGKISILLSVAAYNAGEGRIAKVVRRSGVKSGKRGYSRIIRFLPKETRGYVPEFLAAALILKTPSHYGFSVQKQHPHHYVQLHNPQSIEKIAQLSTLSIKKIRQLNPELRKFRNTPANNFIVRLPTKAASRLKTKLASKARVWKAYTYPIALTSSVLAGKQKKNSSGQPQIIYKVRKGNHLGGVAKMFAVSIRDLRKRNKIHKNEIQVGQTLIIPIKKQLDKKIYRVKSGDSLGRIAQRLGVSIQHLKFVNGVTNPRRLRLGQKLVYYV
ncbi:MAG: transglycosylase SLT domain-containing protein [Methylococcales bacterium]|nr:transglycosylase SLT domain-containing protein [Methylococcales bacterium]